MRADDILGLFSPWDFLALVLLAACWALLGRRIESDRAASQSVTVLMAAYRREWMRQFITRAPRIYDATIIGNLRQSTSFLASATMIALGGLLALIGNSERLVGVAQDLTLGSHNPRAVEIKLMLAGLFLTHAFLKFLWSNRLFGYASVIMSAVPNDPADPLCLPRATQAAEVNIRAAFNFNRGLRSTYFALASLVWLIGPWSLIGAVAVVSYMIWWREFASASRNILLDPPPPSA
ncbi:DUF599 domain-containing protein [Pararhodobacter sp.]|uniref:DUF599 domain-containing protein n=1 Tax=Pararhodobacter sp. TaxID=2127056 RepID=UPI002AFE3066|nr:DUF599 domain-containing protein [Pararhodobacter sp.]